MTLTSHVAFITGAGSGLGAAMARRLAADGATIVVNDMNAQAATEIATEVGGMAMAFDVTDSSAMDAGVDAAVTRFGRLDIFVNNAGIAPPLNMDRLEISISNQMARMEGRVADMVPTGAITGLSDDDWDRMIRTHLYGTFYGIRAAMRHMIVARSGSIINISSVLGQRPEEGPIDYSAAKAGIIAATKSAAREAAPFGVRVNAVCPGWIDTPLLAQYPDVVMAGIVGQIGMARMGQATEIAELVRFIAGPESSYSNGDVFTASGAF